jgi:hypothetical protein
MINSASRVASRYIAKMGAFDLGRAEDTLDALLDSHEGHVDQAAGFGLRQASAITPMLEEIADDLYKAIRLGSGHRVDRINVENDEIEIIGQSNLTYKWGSYGSLDREAPKGADKDIVMFEKELPAMTLRALGDNADNFTMETQYGDKNYLFVVLKPKAGAIVKGAKERAELLKMLAALPDAVGFDKKIIQLVPLKKVKSEKLVDAEVVDKLNDRLESIKQRLVKDNPERFLPDIQRKQVNNWWESLNRAQMAAYYLWKELKR